MLIVGIDPGIEGGMAIIPLFAFHQTRVFSNTQMTPSDYVDLFSEMRYGDEGPAHPKDTRVEVYLEKPSLNPFTGRKNEDGTKQHRNAQSYYKLGISLGWWTGLCQAFNFRPTEVFPTKWQNALDCRTGGDKNISKRMAEDCFPFLKRDSNSGSPVSLVTHYVADALLIALYGYLEHSKVIPKPVQEALTYRRNKHVQPDLPRPKTTMLATKPRGTTVRTDSGHGSTSRSIPSPRTIRRT